MHHDVRSDRLMPWWCGRKASQDPPSAPHRDHTGHETMAQDGRSWEMNTKRPVVMLFSCTSSRST